jgi:preprotein translocase subunit SecY
LPSHDDDPLQRYSAPLVAVVLAVVLSVMMAALAAGQLDGEYATRALAYTLLVLWVLAGAVVMFMLAHRAESGRLSAGRVLLWTATIWLWPLFALLAWRGRGERRSQ